ncbi:RHS repeat-associated core domain-containing protein [Micromonospora halophytica]|uniref:Intein C-terminal splicing region/intein N-terminal splicing region/RHS repeat-associated core domain-containing protein n=1 Tax=Micromonospora halophytica TaxID=47864 RepID=A0A1C5JLS8_9ACTN|nr:RHS repeat-associated core domain-containing protein [Micromonospora halophytica]SCG71554.1 intein C-terminal splicing region/intein N-terminal splicing region/RHS repeat-associated core domain-containing protein [Micromonospora halophytica]
MAVSLLSGVPAVAKPLGDEATALPTLPPGRSVKGVRPLPTKVITLRNDAKSTFRPTRTNWPKAASASVVLPSTAQGNPSDASVSTAKVRAVGTPVWAQPVLSPGQRGGPGTLVVSVADRKATEAAGVEGILLSVTPDVSAGTVRVGIDYGQFAEAYGGNYGARLRLVSLPECALSTPAVDACRTPKPLPSHNDLDAQTVSAQVPLSSPAADARTSADTVVLAAIATAGEDGGKGGTYAATDLMPSGSWSAGGSTGSFTYSYPVEVPATRSKLAPQISFSYNSASVDGKTASTNAQASWVGDGWSTPRSYIEQSFVSCKDEPGGKTSPKETSDWCYTGPVLTIALNGSTSSLVWDSTKQIWKAQNDSGAVITRVMNSSNGSGTRQTDYWRVVERDGTTYEFGRNRLPGWTSGKPETKSVDHAPVYSPHSDGPCYDSAGFSSSVCTMAYRWNLDYVTDVHGNAMAYYYDQAVNHYGRNEGTTDVPYISDSWLTRIDYGFRDAGAYGTVPNRVVFNTGDRCLSGTCQPLNSSTKANWPDVPYDLICNKDVDCNAWSPSFFSTVRLTSIQTQQYDTATTPYKPVDTYALSHTLPPTGDGTSPTLWLDSITRTGHDTTSGGSIDAISMPSVSFSGIKLPNRVDVTGGFPSFYRQRIFAITTETGSVISPTFELPQPCVAPVTVSPASNTKSCFPIYWTPDGLTNPKLDWFNKYMVTKVVATDPTGGAPATATSYEYDGGAAWHFDDNEVVKAKYRTYGQFRGYAKVRTRSGDGVNNPRTLSETAYYRGMSRNNNNTTVVDVTDSQGGKHEDLDELAGRALETTSYLGDGGPIDSSVITSYWVSDASATRARTGLPALTATVVAPVQVWRRQAITTDGTTSWRYSQTDMSYDASVTSPTFGLIKHQYDHTVPADPAHDECTSITYAPKNTGLNLVGLISQQETVSVACGGFTPGSPTSVPDKINTLTAPATVNRPSQVKSHVRTHYDDPTFSTTFPQAAPTRGTVTMVRKASDWVSGAYEYQTTDRAEFDQYGRTTGSWDGNGNKTTTSYTDNAAGLTTGLSVTNADGHLTQMTLTPPRNLPTSTTDPNGIVTRTHYDALGRTTAVWLASRATTSPANVKHSYTVSKTGPTATTTQQLSNSNGYRTSTTIYDALHRVRQTQSDTPQGGRMITDSFYDSRGWVRATYNGWWDAGSPPGTTPVHAADLAKQVFHQTFNTYDGLGRVIVTENARDGVVKTTTRTVYNGDRTTVIPPAGGTTMATVTDSMGRAEKLLQYTSEPTLHSPTNPFTGPYHLTGGTTVSTTYGYDGHGNQTTLTDSAGNTWVSRFNLLGQVVAKDDPDAGESAMRYDGAGNLIETTDSRGKTLSYTYDSLHRRTASFAATVADQASDSQLAAWVYDNDNAASTTMTYPIGKLTTATAFRNDAAYITQSAGFDAFGSSLGETITIPAVEGPLGNTYGFSHRYNASTGLPTSDTFPARGNLPAETVLRSYSGVLDLPSAVGGLASYTRSTEYDAWGRVTRAIVGSTTSMASILNVYDDHNSRRKQQHVAKTTTSTSDVNRYEYEYDPFGNIIKTVNTRYEPSTVAETQCYRYDSLRQLRKAWTATDGCAITPTTTNRTMVGSGIGSTSAYWTEWNIDALGNRESQTQYSLTGGTDTTTSYTYDGNGAGQPHTLTGTSTTGGLTGSTTYTYDPAGNMTTRQAGQGTQTLNWDDSGELASVTGGSDGDSTFLHDADGNLLIQKDPGKTTLYLPGEQIVLDTQTQTLSGTRYYALPIGAMAHRTGSGTAYGFTIPDHQGTPSLYLNNTAQVPTWRQYTPYGAPRGTTVSTPDNRGFLNKPLNPNTGLTQIGARNYDPTIGRFVSVDPLQDLADPQQWNGYSYANNSPVTMSDPSGLIPSDCLEFDCYGYDPRPLQEGDGRGAGGCPGGCGTDANKEWGKNNGKKSTKANQSKDPRNLGWGIVVPPTVPKEEFLRRWNEQRAEYFGNGRSQGNNADWMRADTRALAMLICAEMGRPGGCQEWIGKLWDGHYNWGAENLPADDKLLPPNVGAMLKGAGPRGGSPARGCMMSFSGDTYVLMADGTSKRLDEIEVGDEVLATDPETGEHGPRVVEHVWVHTDELVDLKIGDELLTTTEDHPFWNHTELEWQRADELDHGALLAGPDGRRQPVGELLLATTRVLPAYNLTVSGIHTYYVLAGNTPVLVHNANRCVISPQGWKHVQDFHRPGGVGVDRSKGVFTGTDDEVQDLIGQTVQRGRPQRNTQGRDGTVYEWDFGRPIGTKSRNSGGGEAQQIRVVVNPDGTLRTAHPF